MVKEVSLQQINLRVTVGDDGVWLHFSSDTGRSAVFNMSEVAPTKSLVIRAALEDWIKDMQESV